MGDGLLRAVVCAVLLAAMPVSAEPGTANEDAHLLLATYHTDPARIDRARDVLEHEAAEAPWADKWADLSRACFLFGELRASSREERLAAYGHGRAAGLKAIELAPHSEAAHVWHAVNSGRWAETKGILQAVITLGELREEIDLILTLNRDSIEGNTIKGSLLAALPRFMGGDPVAAAEYFQRALRADPRRTGPRVELARLYLAGGHRAEAIQELHAVREEEQPSDAPYWALRDEPQARAMLAALGEPTKTTVVAVHQGIEKPAAVADR